MNQESKTARIFLACACGSGIGSLTALQLGHFWGLGALLGALAGYLTYDLEQIVNMIPVAWKMTASVASLEINPKPIWNWFKDVWLGSFAIFSFAISLTIFLHFFLFLFLFLNSIGSQQQLNLLFREGWMLLMLLLICSIFIAAILSLASQSTLQEKNNNRKFFIGLFKNTNPVTVYLYYPAQIVIWVVPQIPAGAVILYNFLKNLFLLIHSDLRLLCGINSLIGAVVGYFSGNVLVGALAGGLLGVVDYEIVSKQILKVHLKS